MKVFVTGVNGQLGYDCVKELAGRRHEVTGSDIQEECPLPVPYVRLDITDPEAVRETVGKIRPDAVIVSDPGLFMVAKARCPSADIHISTQTSSMNVGTFRFWQDLGASRVVCARELTLEEIGEIHAALPDLEIEAFVHGAMCVSHSGRCLLSSFMAERSANRGACAHPCRWKYVLMEEKRPGEYMPVEEDAHGTYIMNSRDLCMIGRIPDLIDAGIDSFKIEGRMKNALYVAVTARAYRMAIDDALKNPALYRSRVGEYLAEIKKCTYRPFTTGFYDGAPQESILYDSCDYQSGAVFLGTVEALENGEAVLTQKNKFSVGDEIEVMKPDGRNLSLRVASIRREDGTAAQSAPHPKERLRVAFEGSGFEETQIGDVLRSRCENAAPVI